MDKEILITEFLDRVDAMIDIEPCDCEKSACNATASIDRTGVRLALDRLFKDLKDFAKEPAKPKKER